MKANIMMKVNWLIWKVRGKISYELKKLQPDNKLRVMIMRMRSKSPTQLDSKADIGMQPYVDLNLRMLTLRKLEK
jgi:hypothetical protein